MPQPITQDMQRRQLTLPDQFKRKWHFTVEKATDDPTGSFNRVGWKDPLKTPQGFVTVPREVTQEGAWRSIVIDFPAWIAQQETAETQWYDTLMKTARKEYRTIDPKEVGMIEHDHYLRAIVGPKPWPSSTVLKAARDGDRQYLGLGALDNAHRTALGLPIEEAQMSGADAPARVERPSTEIPPEPDKYQDFVSWKARYFGIKDLTQIGKDWQAKKQRAAVA